MLCYGVSVKFYVVLKLFQSSMSAYNSQEMKTQQSSAASDQNDAIVRLFNDFDVKETSYHLAISHLDLHICDDIYTKEQGKSFIYYLYD